MAAEPGPVSDDTGRCQLVASASLEEMTAPDVVVIGGTLFDEEPDPRVVQWLREVHPGTTWTTSVCTGSLYPAAAGILDGQDATTHWAYAQELERRGARYTEQRVVEHGKVITAAGVSAGIDMALTLLARMYGPELAQITQLGIEYDPQPPFDTGSPSKAPAEMVEVVRSQLNTLAAADAGKAAADATHAGRAGAEHACRLPVLASATSQSRHRLARPAFRTTPPGACADYPEQGRTE